MGGQTRGRGDVDDRAPAVVADRRRAMLHPKHWTGQIDGKRAVPGVDGAIRNALTGDRPGIVDEDMEFTETRPRGRDKLLPGPLLGNVLAQSQNAAALVCD